MQKPLQFMLTRRIFRHLTNSVLSDSPISIPCLAVTSLRSQPAPSPPSRQRIGNEISHAREQRRHGSSSSSTRWKSRQSRDPFTREAKVSALRSRAAFKLLQIDSRYKLFKPGQTVVDLGYAPGSWSQVAVSKVGDTGRVIGIDILPVQPPNGVSTIQGNFLSQDVRDEVMRYVRDDKLGRLRKRGAVSAERRDDEASDMDVLIDEYEQGYRDMERHADLDLSPEPSLTTSSPLRDLDRPTASTTPAKKLSRHERDAQDGRVVDLLLSDMCAPLPQTTSLHSKSVTNAYAFHRMSNTTGTPSADHLRSMDLCFSALTFGYDMLKSGGGFVCKFFDGAESKDLEGRLKKLFERVVREKPEGSRQESREQYFVCMRRKVGVKREDVLGGR